MVKNNFPSGGIVFFPFWFGRSSAQRGDPSLVLILILILMLNTYIQQAVFVGVGYEEVKEDTR